MKYYKLSWMMAAILICSQCVLTSCGEEDNAIAQPEPKGLVLTGDAAIEWTRTRLDSLVGRDCLSDYVESLAKDGGLSAYANPQDRVKVLN